MKNLTTLQKIKFTTLYKCSRQKGFSLMEVMLVIAIIAIVTAVALPSFTETMRRYRVTSARDNLSASINFARVEAIRTGRPVVIQKSPSSTACSAKIATASDWGCGWIIFVDKNYNSTQDLSTEPTIQAVAEPKGVGVTHPGSAAAVRFVINRWGQPGAIGDRFTFFPADTGIGAASTSTTCINAGGRIRFLPGSPACTNT